jgi:hypothetical protein
LTCQGYSSSDAQRCERALDPQSKAEVPVYLPQQQLAALVLDGLRAGLAENRLEAGLLELTTALRIALDAPDVQQRWLAGEDVFARARLD